MRAIATLGFIAFLLSQAAIAQSGVAQAGAPVETVTSEAPKTPLEKAIDGFVKSYAAPTMAAGKIPKWRNGICPAVAGLTAGENLGVAALLRQVAAKVGAPVVTGQSCNPNVMIVFTASPQAVLDDMAKNHEALLGYHEISQLRRIATMQHPVQAWYATATRSSNGSLVADSAQQTPRCADAQAEASSVCGSEIHITDAYSACSSAVQNLVRYCGGRQSAGSLVNDGVHSEISFVTVVVDTGKLGEVGLKQVANYVAMLALSQTQSFETCEPLVSIVNVMTGGCSETFKPDALSESDLAYLGALYRMNPDGKLTYQQASIAHQMEAAVGKQ